VSEEVKRYNFSVDNSGSVRGYESEHGRWVKRADYEAVLAEKDMLLRALEELLELYEDDEGCRELEQYRQGASVIARLKGDVVCGH